MSGDDTAAKAGGRRVRGRNGDDAGDGDAAAAAAAAAAPPAGQLIPIGRVHKQLSKRNAALYSCLCSIVDDAAFVYEVSLLYPTLPVVANLRAGLWFAAGAWRRRREALAAASSTAIEQQQQQPPPTGLTAYFKSTDGHHGEWSFSTTRLNWPLALLLADKGGALLVDATRRGKRFPDALAKTAPCWCAVLNRAVACVRSGASAAGNSTTITARRAGSLPRHPSLGDWAAAAASGGPQPSGLRAVPSLNEWLDEKGAAEEERKIRRTHDEEEQQQQHHALPSLPEVAPSLPPLPPCRQQQQQQEQQGPPAWAQEALRQAAAAAAAAAGEQQQTHEQPSSWRRAGVVTTTGVGGGDGDAQAPAPLLRPTPPPPPPVTPAPPTNKRRLPWWHADAVMLGEEQPEEEEQQDEGSDASDDDADDARGGQSDDRTGGLPPPTADANPSSPTEWDTSLHLPPWIGRSEAAQIEARLDGWVDALLSAAGRPAVEALSSRLGSKPLRPLWLCQGSRIFTDAVAQPSELPFVPLVLVSASDPRAGRRPLGPAHAAVLRHGQGGAVGAAREEEDDTEEEEDDDDGDNDTDNKPRQQPAAAAATYEYLPGAGDDEESWARGLTPAVFWANAGEILSAGEAGAEAAARRVIERLAGERHHASERDARRAAAGLPGYAVTTSAGPAVGAAAAAGEGEAAAPAAGEAAWPLGDDVPLVLGGLASARLPEARAFSAILLVGPSVHASLVPELERTRAQAEAWLAAIGGEATLFPSSEGAAAAADPASSSAPPPPPDILWLPVGGPKADRCSLTLALGPALRFLAAHLSRRAGGGAPPVLIADADGTSTCVCVAAAALQAMFGAEGEDDEEGMGGDGQAEEEGLIGRRVRLRPGAAEALALGQGLAAACPQPPTRESVKRWVAFAASRYPPARPHRLAVKSVWAFFAAASGSGGRRGLPSHHQPPRAGD